MTPEGIGDRIGHLSPAQVYAALAYYHANWEEIEADIATSSFTQILPLVINTWNG
jgi:hypothetical protein